MTSWEIAFIKFVEALIIPQIAPFLKENYNLLPVRPSLSMEDMVNKIDYLFRNEITGEEVWVQIKVRHPKFANYGDVRITVAELWGMTNDTNPSQFQIQVDLGVPYEEINLKSRVQSFKVLDLREGTGLRSILDRISHRNIASDLAWGIEAKNLLFHKYSGGRYLEYYDKNNILRWVLPSCINDEGKECVFIPDDLMVEGLPFFTKKFFIF